MKRILVFWGFIVIAVILSMRFGMYNIAATESHWPITFKCLEMVRNWSISARASGVEAPPLDDAKLIGIGTEHFHQCCRMCHGAPRIPRHELAYGLYPVPPGLTGDETKGLHDEELYWIVKNGIKMTGMGSYGGSHSEQELWGIVAFLRKYPEITPKQYEELTGYVESCDPE